jgi:glycosyltransferase involved in cell wall biosynthesis
MEPLTGSPRSALTADGTHRLGAVVSAIIPCLDEEEAVATVVRNVLDEGVAEVIVVDGGSRDRTVERAKEAGACVVTEPRRGYGRAVLRGIEAARPDAAILLFLDGDGSDRPRHVPDLIHPIVTGEADFVHGTRLKGEREAGSLSLPQLVAGRIAGLLLRANFGVRFTDMSPYRAVRRDLLDELGMREETFGWNLEMLMRVAASGVRVQEISVGQRRRTGGVSKVSGDLRTAIRAAAVIVTTFLRVSRDLKRPAAPRIEGAGPTHSPVAPHRLDP